MMLHPLPLRLKGRDIEAELEPLTVNAGRAPKRDFLADTAPREPIRFERRSQISG